MDMSLKEETSRYHSQFYRENELFSPGSWLEHSDPYLLETLIPELSNYESLRILDLGGGVGRNAIVLAKHLRNSHVDSVDVLPIASEKLLLYAAKHDVADRISAITSDVSSFRIPSDHYDVILAISVLEYCSSAEELAAKVSEIQCGTRPGGLNYLMIGGDIRERSIETGAVHTESRFSDGAQVRFLQPAYRDWKVSLAETRRYEEILVRNGIQIHWESDYVSWAAWKRA